MLKINVNFDFQVLCQKILSEQLVNAGIEHRLTSFGEAELLGKISSEQLAELGKSLSEYGIEIIEDQKTALVQKIKDAIIEMVYSDDNIQVKASVYLAEKLGHSYGYLSNIFSQVTYTSVENFIILQKIERAKQLLLLRQLSLTDIAHKLNYSSVAHLSTQFKNTTGMTPSAFQKIIQKRKQSQVN